MPLCSSSTPPSTTLATILAPIGSLDLELNLAVVEEQLPARRDLAHELAVCRIDVLGVALPVAGDDANRLPVLQHNRAALLEPPRPDLRTAQILKYRHDLRRAGRSRADFRKVSACASCVPWEKLSRHTSTPALMSCSMISSVRLAGPMVAMIFV
jgi:hypothetical protein